MLVLPYVKGLSEKIRLVCRPLNIKTAFRSSSTLRSLLTHVKAPTPPEEQKCVVYRVPCECGSVYVGETGRQMKTRIEEHKRAVMKADPNNAIAEHVWSTGHKIQWDETTSIDHDGDWFRRRIKEALHIRIHKIPHTLLACQVFSHQGQNARAGIIYITLHYITLHYITLHYITLPYIIYRYGFTLVFCNLHCIYLFTLH